MERRTKMINLNGKTALVTGGAKGLGRTISMVLAEQGAMVAIGDIDLDGAEETSSAVKSIGLESMAINLDVTSFPSVREITDRIVSDWGKIDILINNAGVAGLPNISDGEETYDDRWRFTLDVNLMGVVHCTDGVLPHMGKAHYGKIVNIASTAGKPGDPHNNRKTQSYFEGNTMSAGSAYAASKAAVLRHTQIVAREVAKWNINVNAVCPSRLITPMGLSIASATATLGTQNDKILELRRRDVLENNLFGRELCPEDVAKLVAFLVSEDSRNITGQSINVDGGFKNI